MKCFITRSFVSRLFGSRLYTAKSGIILFVDDGDVFPNGQFIHRFTYLLLLGWALTERSGE